MMAKPKIKQSRIDNLIDDAAYLQKEAEALQYVISEVPYREKPPEGHSVAEILLLIDHAQFNYFQPVFEDAINQRQPTQLNNFEHFKNTFRPDPEALENIQELLHNLANHRAALVNKFKKPSIIIWSTRLYDDNEEILLIDFMQRMIHFDHVQLKKITHLVMAYNQQKSMQREMQQRKPNQADHLN